MIMPELLSILACPACNGELCQTDEGQGLLCHSCGLLFPVRNGIPVMLIDQAEKISR